MAYVGGYASGYASTEASDPVFTQWRAALANRDTTPAVWYGIGESLQEGQGASTAANRWFVKAAAQLRTTYPSVGAAEYIPARRRVYAPDSGTWVNGYSASTGTLTFQDTTYGDLGHKVIAMAAGATMTFTVTGVAATIWWVGLVGGGTFTYQVDGGTVSSGISTVTASTQPYKTTSVTLGAQGSHTVKITATSAVTIAGLQVYSGNTTSGIHAIDGGWSSATVQNPFLNNLAQWQAALQVLQPDLVTIELGGNDTVNGTAVATFKANALSLINALRAQTKVPSIVWVFPYRVASSITTNDFSLYQTAIKQLIATDPSIGLISWLDQMPQATTSGTGLYSTDGIHPNDSGQTTMANIVAPALVPPAAAAPATVVTAPTRVQSIVPTDNTFSDATVAKTSAAVNVQAGDLIVLFSGSGDATNPISNPTASGGSITWTLRQSYETAGDCATYCWTGAVGATASVTISLSPTNGIGWGWTASLWRNHGGVGNSAKAQGTGAPSVTLAASAKSAVLVASDDYNALVGSTRTWRTVDGSPLTESSYVQSGTYITHYEGYDSNISTAGSFALGLTAPTGQRFSSTAVEILGKSSNGYADTVNLSGSGTFGVSGKPLLLVTDALSGSGTLSFAGAITSVGSVTFAGSGSLTNSGRLGVNFTDSLSGSGTLGLSGVVAGGSSYTGTINLSGSGTLSNSSARPTLIGSLSFSGTGTLANSSNSAAVGAVALSGLGTLGLSSNTTVANGAVTLSGLGSLGLSGTIPTPQNFSGTLGLNGSGTLNRIPGTGPSATVPSGSKIALTVPTTATIAVTGFTPTPTITGTGASRTVATPLVTTDTVLTIAVTVGTSTASRTVLVKAATARARVNNSWVPAYRVFGPTSGSRIAATLTINPDTALQPVGPPGTWNLAFNDDFETASLDPTKWIATEGYIINGVTPTHAANVSVVNGNAVLTLPAANSGAWISTAPTDGANPGYRMPVNSYAEARIYFPGGTSGAYNWGAFWTGGPNWPMDGEHDIVETLAGASTVNYHYGTDSGVGHQTYSTGGVSGTWHNGYHTYGLHRRANFADVYFDGVLVRTYPTNDTGVGQALYVSLGNDGSNLMTGVNSQVKVDWVRAWTPVSVPTFSSITKTFPTPAAGIPAGFTGVLRGGNVSINSSGQLALATGSGSYADGPAVLWSEMVPIADMDVTADFGMTLNEQYPTFSIRSTYLEMATIYPHSGYIFEFNPAGNGWEISKRIHPDTRIIMAGGSYTFNASVRTKVRFRVSGTTLQMKIWAATGTEPAAWTYSTVDSDVTGAGRVLFSTCNGDDGAIRTVTIDNLTVNAA